MAQILAIGNTSQLGLEECCNSGKSESILSHDVIVICHWIIYTAVCQTISIFGVGTNIVNVICFVKQGFRDPVNVSLLGLAISDIGCLLTMISETICFTPAFSEADLPFDAVEVSYLTGGIPHTTFTRITGCMTALITLERCLCITFPLKVKSIVTPRRAFIIIVCVFVILIASVAPIYVVNRFDVKFSPVKNKSIIGIHYTEDRDIVDKVSYVINNVLIPFFSFMIILICTIVLAIKLDKNSKWRKMTTNSAQADSTSSRNQKVAKMVIMISILFIACFTPLSIIFIAMCLVPEFSVYGKHRDLLFIIGGVGFILETINSSVNIFIYYHMSTKYRSIYRQCFCMNEKDPLEQLK